jgi:hypothetical protein
MYNELSSNKLARIEANSIKGLKPHIKLTNVYFSDLNGEIIGLKF